ncbi:hypothetical protein O3P69_014012 [Scylla paramamosain]|uniref:Uncharacterized protein n=1 Tax=Scylla paramamosain TaxID=85552 RepID=A0AAW0SRM3_SCYPA
MKLVILACLAAVALARPQNPDSIEILRQETVDNGDGNFNYLFETENGIYKEVVGSPSANGAQTMRGSYRFPLDDGTIVEVTFTADENGFLPVSDSIPTPHPLPAHVIETLAIVDELPTSQPTLLAGRGWEVRGAFPRTSSEAPLSEGERCVEKNAKITGSVKDAAAVSPPYGKCTVFSRCALPPSLLAPLHLILLVLTFDGWRPGTCQEIPLHPPVFQETRHEARQIHQLAPELLECRC